MFPSVFIRHGGSKENIPFIHLLSTAGFRNAVSHRIAPLHPAACTRLVKWRLGMQDEHGHAAGSEEKQENEDLTGS